MVQNAGHPRFGVPGKTHSMETRVYDYRYCPNIATRHQWALSNTRYIQYSAFTGFCGSSFIGRRSATGWSYLFMGFFVMYSMIGDNLAPKMHISFI